MFRAGQLAYGTDTEKWKIVPTDKLFQFFAVLKLNLYELVLTEGVMR